MNYDVLEKPGDPQNSNSPFSVKLDHYKTWASILWESLNTLQGSSGLCAVRRYTGSLVSLQSLSLESYCYMCLFNKFFSHAYLLYTKGVFQAKVFEAILLIWFLIIDISLSIDWYLPIFSHIFLNSSFRKTGILADNKYN